MNDLMPEEYKPESKIYVIKKNDGYRENEPIIDELIKKFSVIMAESFKKNIETQIQEALVDKYNDETNKAFKAAFNSIFEDESYRSAVNFTATEKVHTALQEMYKKFEALQNNWQGFTALYRNCSINGTGHDITAMSKQMANISKLLNTRGSDD